MVSPAKKLAPFLSISLLTGAYLERSRSGPSREVTVCSQWPTSGVHPTLDCSYRRSRNSSYSDEAPAPKWLSGTLALLKTTTTNQGGRLPMKQQMPPANLLSLRDAQRSISSWDLFPVFSRSSAAASGPRMRDEQKEK